MNMNSSLLDTVRGQPPYRSLPYFPLEAHHLNSVVSAGSQLVSATPCDFHSFLCNAIRKAKRRVLLASLYVGPAVGDAPAEKELLLALKEAHTKNITIKVLMDASRGLRPVGGTSSAQAVYKHLSTSTSTHSNDSASSKVYLFPVLHTFIQSFIPSPADEVAGVFHLKVYIIDDQLVLTGANLSEEYFQDRQDRYLLFDQGANGFVDFYAQVFDCLSYYAHEYHPGKHIQESTSQDRKVQRHNLYTQLSSLFQDRPHQRNIPHQPMKQDPVIIAYVVPTFQVPAGFFSQDLPFPSDSNVTQTFVRMAKRLHPSSTIRLSSAYLNPTPSLLSALSTVGPDDSGNQNHDSRVILLTAGTKSHGFAPKLNKRTSGKDRSWIPAAFLHIMDDIAANIYPKGGKILLYERDHWTFHAKGLWLTQEEDCGVSHVTIEKPESTLLGTIVGSGNFGYRSEKLDFESNALIYMNPDAGTDHKLKPARLLVQDWNDWCHHVTPFRMHPTVSLSRGSSESLPSFYKSTIRHWGLRTLVRLGRKFF